MDYELDRDDGPKGEPSLTDMTKKAIEILQRGENGYFLMVEGNINFRKLEYCHNYYLCTSTL